MAEKQIIPAVVGLSGGFVIAGGVIALMDGLGSSRGLSGSHIRQSM